MHLHVWCIDNCSIDYWARLSASANQFSSMPNLMWNCVHARINCWVKLATFQIQISTKNNKQFWEIDDKRRKCFKLLCWMLCLIRVITMSGFQFLCSCAYMHLHDRYAVFKIQLSNSRANLLSTPNRPINCWTCLISYSIASADWKSMFFHAYLNAKLRAYTGRLSSLVFSLPNRIFNCKRTKLSSF